MKISRATGLIFQNHSKKQINPLISLNDMVDNIIRKDKFYEGSSHIIIDKIVSLKNSAGTDGMKEIQEAWAKIDNASIEARHKIDKYFKLGMRADKQNDSSPSEQPLPAKKIQTDQKENTLVKVTERKSDSDDLPNNSIKNNQLSQSSLSEKEPEFQKILASHTIEEAIKIKVVFNEVSARSLNLIESKIKAKFNELKSSKTPELFEREMLNAQEILKKYDNKLVCEKINKIINKYLDEYELYIRENKSPISRIWCAINSVFGLQDITPHKFNEFKMAIIDGFKKEPIENIEKYSSDLMRNMSSYTHKNIANKVNDFITSYSIDRVNELKRDENLSVESKTEILAPQENISTEELMKDISLKKIISHVFKRVINNIRRLFYKD
ncbi:hypothetical protein [Providencia sp.]|uniref:hypothetical protein n=1 Tax=Providencia sp. TaxID=589 RepID=UPI0033402F64